MAVDPEIAEDFREMGREMFEDMVAPGEKYIVPAVYDEITGSLISDEVSYDVEMILDLLEDVISDEELMVGAVRATLLQEDLPVTPTQADIVVDAKGIRYNIESWTEDPAHIIWQLILKKE